MGTSKTEIFTKRQNRLAAMAKALAHPARIAIIEYLSKQDSCICGDIVNEIGLAQSTVSQHLKELKSLGLIQGTVEGVKVCYCINPEYLKKISEDLNSFFISSNKNSSCC